jgi:hypothetical protein
MTEAEKTVTFTSDDADSPSVSVPAPSVSVPAQSEAVPTAAEIAPASEAGAEAAQTSKSVPAHSEPVPAQSTEAPPKSLEAAVPIKPHAAGKSACDVCGATSNVQTLQFSLLGDEVVYTCSNFKCQERLREDMKIWYSDTKQVAFYEVYESIPSLFDSNRSWTVRRSSDGQEEDGWRVVRNWRTKFTMNTFRRLRGEPWWRMPLSKGDKLRWTMLHELEALNKGLVAEGVWAMLPAFLPDAEPEPTDEFTSRYAAAAWYLKKPSDALLLEHRL